MTEFQKPLMAMLVIAYRHENYISEALQAAFAQSYSPLEIVVSDDASPDETWKVIEQEAANYRGPHRLILNRNEKNLGVVGNLVRAVSLTQAPYLVGAAGDDISEPDRVEEIARLFIADAGLKFVTSYIRVVDQQGRLGEIAPAWNSDDPLTAESLAQIDPGYVLGCANAYSRDVFDLFPPALASVSIAEDHYLPFRAALCGGMASIARPLVRYRRHDGNVTNIWRVDDRASGVSAALNNLRGLDQKLADIDHRRNVRPDKMQWLDSLKAICLRSRALAIARTKWEAGGLSGIGVLLRCFLAGDVSAVSFVKTLARVYCPWLWTRWMQWRAPKSDPA